MYLVPAMYQVGLHKSNLCTAYVRKILVGFNDFVSRPPLPHPSKRSVGSEMHVQNPLCGGWRILCVFKGLASVKSKHERQSAPVMEMSGPSTFKLGSFVIHVLCH